MIDEADVLFDDRNQEMLTKLYEVRPNRVAGTISYNLSYDFSYCAQEWQEPESLRQAVMVSAQLSTTLTPLARVYARNADPIVLIEEAHGAVSKVHSTACLHVTLQCTYYCLPLQHTALEFVPITDKHDVVDQVTVAVVNGQERKKNVLYCQEKANRLNDFIGQTYASK